MRILIIEDEPHLAEYLHIALSRRGHDATVQPDGAAGLEAALREFPDLILLDLNLPKLDGLAVLSRLRAAQSTARVLMLTASGQLAERIRGLKAGADDYLAKPFALEELVARVTALGRRGGEAPSEVNLQVGDLQLDVRLRRVTRAGRIIVLSPREFELLQVLMSEPGRFFARTELFGRIWQRDHPESTRTVEMFITRLRRKIDADEPTPLIHTLRNVGYTIRPP